MRPVILFVIILCLISKNKLASSVTVQSIFFVSALIKSGIYSEAKKETRKSVILGAGILIFGFALSSILTRYAAKEETPSFIGLAFLTMSLYLCFYSLLVIMHLCGKSPQKLKTVTLICTLFPCVASISDLSKASPVFYAILPILGSLLLYIAIAHTKKDVRGVVDVHTYSARNNTKY